MRRVLTVTILAALPLALGVVVLGISQAADEEKPKYTIKQVMEKAHKSKLINKLAEGKGTKEEAKELLEMYQALGANKPPRGEAEGWKKKTMELAAAAQDVVDGKEGAGARLTKAANCAQCHKEHKPPQ